MNRPDKDPLPEVPNWQPGEKVVVRRSPGIGSDITVVGPARNPNETLIKIGDIGPYPIPSSSLKKRPPRRKRAQPPPYHGDLNYSRRTNVW